MTLETVTTDVLVVGAGPTGLMLANWLAKLRLDAVVIDPKGGPTRESRALVVQARTMEVYDQLGVIETVLRASWSARSIAPGYEKRQFGSVPIGDLGTGLTPYSRLFVLEQSRNEGILADNLRTLGSEVLWNNSLDSVDTDDRDDEHPVVANVT